MINSTHRVEVFQTEAVLPHPNADSLEILNVFGGYPAVVKAGDYCAGDLAAYIPPDSLVDSGRPEFSFLALPGKDPIRRIRASKLRGILSMGLVMPAPAGSNVGDDVAGHYGVEHYEPPISTKQGEAEPGPPGIYAPVYDVESLRRYPHILEDGERVICAEKVHGSSAKYVYVREQDPDDSETAHCRIARWRYYCGSRTEWKKESKDNLWWKALENTPGLQEFLKHNPGYVVYGEVYGQVQDLKYNGGVNFRAFDILTPEGRWMDHDEARVNTALEFVPLIADIPYRLEDVLALAEGKSRLADHVREGIVVRPARERTHPEIGRVVLKVVGAGYLERK